MTRIISPRFGVSYPDPALNDEPPDVPEDLKKLVDGLELATRYGQGTFANRPISTVGQPGIQGRQYFATDQNVLYYDYGTGWVSVGIPLKGDFSVFVNLTPFQGMEFHLESPVGGVFVNPVWALRYDSLFAPNAWLFTGGSPATVEDNTSDTVTSTTYEAILPGLQLDIPVDGVYLLEYGGRIDNSSDSESTYMSFKYAAGVAVDADAVLVEGNKIATVSRRVEKQLDSSNFVELHGRVTGGTGTFSHMWLSMTPIAISQSI